MPYRNLGRSGLKVSTISLGSWLTIGNALDAATGEAIVRRALDLGINLLDTADVYNDGEAEIALGRTLAKLGVRRQSLVIASKCYFPMSDDVNDAGLSRKHVFESVRGSLQRLGIDYLDLYQCHRPDPETPLEETAMAMDDLIRQGLVLYWGVSYWPARLIVQAVQLCRANGFHPPISNQPPYNLLSRGIEAEVLAASADAGVGQIVFSPLAQGVLSGKYRAGEAPGARTRAANERINRFITRYMTAEQLARVEQLVHLARSIGATPAQVALAWCLRLPEIASAIVGASSVAQLEENARAAELELPADALEELDRVFPGPAAGDSAT